MLYVFLCDLGYYPNEHWVEAVEADSLEEAKIKFLKIENKARGIDKDPESEVFMEHIDEIYDEIRVWDGKELTLLEQDLEG